MKIMSLALLLNVAFAAYPTDLALLKQAVAGALANYTLPGDVKKIAIAGTLTTDRASAPEADALVRDALIEKFGHPGFEIFSGPAPDPDSYTLVVHTTEAAVYYLRRFKKLPWSPTLIQRRARVEVELTLSKNGQILDAKTLRADTTGIVPEQELPIVRSRPFTREEALTTSPNLWEPVMVALIVVALVLAFYGPKSF